MIKVWTGTFFSKIDTLLLWKTIIKIKTKFLKRFQLIQELAEAIEEIEMYKSNNKTRKKKNSCKNRKKRSLKK